MRVQHWYISVFISSAVLALTFYCLQLHRCGTLRLDIFVAFLYHYEKETICLSRVIFIFTVRIHFTQDFQVKFYYGFIYWSNEMSTDYDGEY